MSRDKLLAYLWPERDTEHSRSLLRQSVHVLRSTLGDAAIHTSGDDIRLNTDVVRVDVLEYEAALARSDFQAAKALYGGPFLDGFFLVEAPEFERWAERERVRLAATYGGVLEKLAEAAEAKGDFGAALENWKARALHDPYDSRVALRLMQALEASGNPAAALQHATVHARLLQEEFEAAPPNEIVELAERMRAQPERLTLAKPAPGNTMSTSADLLAAAERVWARSALHWRRVAIVSVVAALVFAAVLIRAFWFGGEPAEERASATRETSIAVLPFANISADQQDAALVDGISDELIVVLAKIPNLRVIARASALAFEDRNADLRRIADSLGVSNILEGGVQKAGSRLRVQVRLLDARNGSTRWSETYDRELKDIFSVQSDIAGAIARELDLRLGESTLARIERGSTRNIAAYELYHRGNNPVLLRSDSGARAAFEYFRQAVALDPNYAAAYAGLARMHVRIGFGDDTELSRRERLALAEQAALRAVALDDSSAEAHSALSMVRRSNYQLVSAEAELKRAVALEPGNARFREWLVVLYVSTERPAEALVEARRALELDPLSPTANAEFANALLANDRCDEALTQLEKLRSLRPPLNRAGAIASQCYAREQMWPEAIAEMQRISANAGPRGQAILGYMLGRGGRTEEARRIMADLRDRSRRINGDAFDVAIVHAGLGENDQAFTWLQKAVDDRSLGFEWLPAIAAEFRRDPRFERFRQRVGLQNL